MNKKTLNDHSSVLEKYKVYTQSVEVKVNSIKGTSQKEKDEREKEKSFETSVIASFDLRAGKKVMHCRTHITISGQKSNLQKTQLQYTYMVLVCVVLE